MGVITTIEDRLIAVTKELFGGSISRVDTVPGPVTLAVLKEMLSSAPAVYYSFLGGKALNADDTWINGRFSAYISSRNRRGSKQRRRGGPNEIGIYEILEHLLPKLNGMTIEGVGTLKLIDVQNLFSIRLEEQLGAALYGVVLEMPRMPFSSDLSTTELHDFLLAHLEHDIDGDGDFEASDDVQIPQE